MPTPLPDEYAPLEAAMYVLGLVRRQFDVPWAELEMDGESLSATFMLDAAAVDAVRLRRGELLARYLDMLVVGHTEGVERRRREAEVRRTRIASNRAWGVAVHHQVEATRSALGRG